MSGRLALLSRTVVLVMFSMGLDVRVLQGATLPAEEYAAGEDWSYYLGNPAATHYSRLEDINTKNVRRLKVAWIYDTKDEVSTTSTAETMNSTMESNPLVINGRLFFISPNGRLISLDAATGRERWTFDPGVGPPAGFKSWRRGVSYWSDQNEQRILFTFADELYAVDADSGRPVRSFGNLGHISLGGRVSSPGVVYKDLIIVGGYGSSIRAFDIRTGWQRWKFHTIPRPGEFGHDTWPPNAWRLASGANNWSGMTLDRLRGIVFVPLAFPQDYYGARRAGDNLFSNSLVALSADTGQRLWHFQTIRHDLWDRDLPAAPTLVRVERDGKAVDAIAQISKVGFVYVLDRLSGKSLFPIVERPAPPSDIKGEITAPTQMEPLLPAPFTRQRVTVDTLTRRTPQASAAVAAQFAELRSRGLWDPPSEQGTIVFPGIDGGAQWGGAAWDPETGILYLNSNEMAWVLKLRRRSASAGGSGGALYRDYCASCHGEGREGHTPDIPSLLGIERRLSPIETVVKISIGGMRMPAFPSLDRDQLDALTAYLRTGIDRADSRSDKRTLSDTKDDYVVAAETRFVDPDGYPAISPPWGTLNAINLNTGSYAWRIPFGTHPELAARGLKDTGSENYGGPIVTAGGLLFIGATSFDRKFRAYDKRTGELLWETVLPAAGNATPSTYRAKGKQFVVIAAGGGRPAQAPSGSSIVAFALPD